MAEIRLQFVLDPKDSKDEEKCLITLYNISAIPSIGDSVELSSKNYVVTRIKWYGNVDNASSSRIDCVYVVAYVEPKYDHIELLKKMKLMDELIANPENMSGPNKCSAYLNEDCNITNTKCDYCCDESVKDEMIIRGIANGEIECKRLYLEGLTAISKCPTCQKENIIDFKQNYLSYPTANSEVTLYFYCEECNKDWQKKAMFKISLEPME